MLKFNLKKILNPHKQHSDWSIQFGEEPPSEVYSSSRFSTNMKLNKLNSLIENLTPTSVLVINNLEPFLLRPEVLKDPKNFTDVYINRFKTKNNIKQSKFFAFLDPENGGDDRSSRSLASQSRAPRFWENLKKRESRDFQVVFPKSAFEMPFYNVSCESAGRKPVHNHFVSLPLISQVPVSTVESQLIRQINEFDDHFLRTRSISIDNFVYFFNKNDIFKVYFNVRKFNIELDIDRFFFQNNFMISAICRWGKHFLCFNLTDQSFYSYDPSTQHIQHIVELNLGILASKNSFPETQINCQKLDYILWIEQIEKNVFCFSDEKGNLYILDLLERTVHQLGFVNRGGPKVIRQIFKLDKELFLGVSKKSSFILQISKKKAEFRKSQCLLNERGSETCSKSDLFIDQKIQNNFDIFSTQKEIINYKMSGKTKETSDNIFHRMESRVNDKSEWGLYARALKIKINNPKKKQILSNEENLIVLRFWNCLIVLTKYSKKLMIINFESGIKKLLFEIPLRITLGLVNQSLDQLILVGCFKNKQTGKKSYQMRIYDLWKLIEYKMNVKNQRYI